MKKREQDNEITKGLDLFGFPVPSFQQKMQKNVLHLQSFALKNNIDIKMAINKGKINKHKVKQDDL